MKEGSLCLIFKGEQVLMILNNRGVSKGNWNFPGGKMDPSETIEECVKREVLEETGLSITNPIYIGKLRFFNPDWAVNVFRATEFTGQVTETEEGRLSWMDVGNLPFDKMWAADRIWVPLAMAGKRVDGSFYYQDNKLTNYKMGDV